MSDPKFNIEGILDAVVQSTMSLPSHDTRPHKNKWLVAPLVYPSMAIDAKSTSKFTPYRSMIILRMLRVA
jgi:hypothetical protein